MKELLTNKLPNDLTFIKTIKADCNDESDECTINLDDNKYILKKTNIWDFFKTFYFKEVILFIAIFLGMFFINKYMFLFYILTGAVYYFIIKKDLIKEYIKYNFIVKGIIVISSFTGVIFGVMSLVKSYSYLLNYAVMSFFVLFLIASLDMFVRIKNLYGRKPIYYIVDELGNRLKGYLVWEI